MVLRFDLPCTYSHRPIRTPQRNTSTSSTFADLGVISHVYYKTSPTRSLFFQIITFVYNILPIKA